MLPAVSVLIHPSQFPERVQRDLEQSLRSRQVNHKFHYDSVKQTQKWLALHQACAPSRNDPDCAATYDAAFNAAATHLSAPRVQLIGLGCGGGQKDTRLLEALREKGKEVSYAPCDVSTAMVLVARQTALRVVSEGNCFPVVCDLATADDLTTLFDQLPFNNAARLVTFFGMIPNFEPQIILPRLKSFVRPEDHLLFSANLAPGRDYAAGMQRILPQYDNPLTRDWLLTFLVDLGVDHNAGNLRFQIEEDSRSGLKRITASFHFSRACNIRVGSEYFVFPARDCVRLFYSYRYTPDRIREQLNNYGLHVRDEWVTGSAEEGVFLCGTA